MGYKSFHGVYWSIHQKGTKTFGGISSVFLLYPVGMVGIVVLIMKVVVVEWKEWGL